MLPNGPIFFIIIKMKKIGPFKVTASICTIRKRRRKLVYGCSLLIGRQAYIGSDRSMPCGSPFLAPLCGVDIAL